MTLLKEPNAEPIPGYRLIAPLGRGGYGEVWKCTAPGGLFKAIKFVYGSLDGLQDGRAAAGELRAIEHVKAIRHPFLLSIDRVECVAGELLIVTELADRNLDEVLQQCRRGGRPGIPRDRLLAYLREAAEVLDLLNVEYGLQHLDVKPRNLFVVAGHIKVADFGLVQSLSALRSGDATVDAGAVTPLYAPPEVFLGGVSRHCDQYSLAVTYQELLTGTFPFAGDNPRQLLLGHVHAEPDLCALPGCDRAVIARALAKDPEGRFPCCAELVRALAAAGPSAVGAPEPPVRWEPPQAGPQPPATGSPLADTDRRAATTPRPAADRSLACESLRGYTLEPQVVHSPLQEVWAATDPEGRPCRVKCLYTPVGGRGAGFEQSLLRLQSVQHPVLLPAEVLEGSPGRLVLKTARPARTLREELKRCQGRGLKGIPRAELLEYLRIAAEGLDYLYRQHSLQHLALNPQVLVLEDGRLLIDEFGLAELFWLPSGQQVAGRNRRYSAPEFVRGEVSPACDQYSLACLYAELLAGQPPAGPADPALGGLPPGDAEAVRRALDPDPERRWPGSAAFVAALEGRPAAAGGDGFAALVAGSSPSGPAVPVDPESVAGLRSILADLMGPGGDAAAAEGDAAPELARDGRSLRFRFTAGIPLGEARLRLDRIREEVFGQSVRAHADGCAFHIDLPTNLWQQWIGRHPGLEVAVSLARHHPLAPAPIDVGVQVQAVHCGKKRGQELLAELGPALLERIRAGLVVNSEKRVQERLLWPHPVVVRPVLPGGEVGPPVECRGKDLSLRGVGFYLPHELTTVEVLIDLPATAHTGAVSIPATLVRAVPCADGWYEVGALFRIATFRNSVHDLQL